jgi:hypothetical protein
MVGWECPARRLKLDCTDITSDGVQIVMRSAILAIGVFVAVLAQPGLAVGQLPNGTSPSAILWAEAKLHQGGIIEFNERCNGALDDAADPRWNDACRTLTGDQLADLIRGVPAATPTTHSIIQIVGAHVLGDVDLRGSEPSRPLMLQNSRVDGGLLLSDSHFKWSVTLTRLFVADGLIAQDIQADSGLTVANAQLGGAVNFHNARIDGDVVLTGSRFANDLNLNSAQITGSLFLDNAHVSGRMLMSSENVDRNSGAKIDQSTFFNGTTFDGAILGNEARIGQDLNLTSAKCGEVWLVAAKIGGFLKMTGATFNGILQAGNVQVGQSLAAPKAVFHGDVYFDAANSSANMRLDGANFDQQFSATELSVQGRLTAIGAVFKGPVDFTASKVGWQLELTGASFAKTVDATDLDVKGRFDLSATEMTGDLHLARSRVGDSLDLHGSRFLGEVDLTALDIGHDLTLVAFDHGTEVHPASWEASGTGKNVLWLYNAHVGSLTDGISVWPPTLQFYLNGLTYGSLLGWPIDARENWLDRGNVEHYPQPYRQMAAVLTAAGARDAALDVQFHGRQQERREACAQWRLSRCINLTMLEFTIGYGIGGYAFRVLAWVLGLFMMGWLILLQSPVARRKGLIWCVGATWDRLLPIVELNPEFKDFFNDPERQRLRGWQLAAFAVIGILGWVLSLYLVAALTGLTQSG